MCRCDLCRAFRVLPLWFWVLSGIVGAFAVLSVMFSIGSLQDVWTHWTHANTVMWALAGIVAHAKENHD